MISAIVLAAGESRRMGAHKVLLPLGSVTVIGHIVDQLLLSVIDRVFVVVGHEGDRIVHALSDRSVTVITNHDYMSGMLSSVRCGIEAMPEQSEAVMVALGDQPSITAELVDNIVRSFRTAGKGILVPLHQGRRGHPIMFSAEYCTEILGQYDDVGLRGLMRGHPEDVFELNVESPAILSDMDFPEDYDREVASFNRNAEKNRFPKDE